ncbi:hypothetical protein ACFLY3_00045 [Chloroflexota bacterium]
MISNTTLFRWIMVWGVISIVSWSTLSTWGYIGAIVSAIFVVGGAVFAVAKCCKTKHPFRIVQYKKKISTEAPKHRLFMEGNVDSDFGNEPPLRGAMRLKPNQIYSFWLELSPKIPVTIESVNIRFLGSERMEDNRPKAKSLRDANRRYQKYFSLSGDNNKGCDGWYEHNMNASCGKDIYYWAQFHTSGDWKGKLSLKFKLMGLSYSSVRIGCVVS